MIPPIFATCMESSEVIDLLGSSPMRVYQFGRAPQNVVRPYAVWQVVGGTPENYLGNVPDIDRFATQIDVYATTASDARDVARAMRDAIEPVAHIVGWRGEDREPETQLYRVSFDVDWFVHR
jgi:hypothetical protein